MSSATPVLEVLAGLARHGVSLALSADDRLVVQPPPSKGNVPPEARDLLDEHREQIVAELHRRRTLGDSAEIKAWLCISCQTRYPAEGRDDHLCVWCGLARRGSQASRPLKLPRCY
jgi:hypothetical protein